MAQDPGKEGILYNKIIVNGEVKIDLTGDTVIESKLLEGYTAHKASGEIITGTCTYDCDTSNVSAIPAEVLSGKTYGAMGNIKTGTMPNHEGNGGGSISTKTGTHTIAEGYHDGSGKVKISDVEQAKIIAENIKEGVEILGVVGTCNPSSTITATSETVTPTFALQNVLPPAGYDYLTQVTVASIPVTSTINSANGYTLTIG